MQTEKCERELGNEDIQAIWFPRLRISKTTFNYRETRKTSSIALDDSFSCAFAAGGTWYRRTCIFRLHCDAWTHVGSNQICTWTIRTLDKQHICAGNFACSYSLLPWFLIVTESSSHFCFPDYFDIDNFAFTSNERCSLNVCCKWWTTLDSRRLSIRKLLRNHKDAAFLHFSLLCGEVRKRRRAKIMFQRLFKLGIYASVSRLSHVRSFSVRNAFRYTAALYVAAYTLCM